MHCKATAYDYVGTRVAVRTGYWNGSTGFGWSKADYYHNLWMQPMLDTIRYGIITGSRSSEHYDVYHYDSKGYVDQYVYVVSDNVDPYFKGTHTHDGHSVGVITGYCNNGKDQIEEVCPDWVDHTL